MMASLLRSSAVRHPLVACAKNPSHSYIYPSLITSAATRSTSPFVQQRVSTAANNSTLSGITTCSANNRQITPHLCTAANVKVFTRCYQSMAKSEEGKPTSSQTRAQVQPKKTANDPLGLNNASHISAKQQRDTDWTIVKKLIGHIWPKGDRGTKIRVVLALLLLIGGKVRFRNRPECSLT